MQQAFGLKRLFDEIHRPAPDRGHRRIDVAMAGKDDDRQIRLTRLDRVQHFQPIHGRTMQPHIEQHQRGSPAVHLVQRGAAVACGPAFIAFVRKHTRHQFADVLFIINDQDIDCHQALPLFNRIIRPAP